MISLLEDKTEFNPGHTVYYVLIEHNKEKYEVKVKREENRFTCVEADDIHPGLQSIARAFARNEFAKIFVLGDY